MATPPPFEVSKAWQDAMTIVSVNAGMRPHEILTQYYRQQPVQSDQNHTDVDLTGATMGGINDIKAASIRYEDNNPSKISGMTILINGLDPNTHIPIRRVITNTSIHHVLERQPGSNCPLWLKVHADNDHKSSPPYDIIPCCPGWINDMRFDQLISDEEKHLPGVVDHALRVIQSYVQEKAEAEKELQELREEMEELKNLAQVLEDSGSGPGPGQGLVASLTSAWSADPANLPAHDMLFFGVIFLLVAVIIFK